MVRTGLGVSLTLHALFLLLGLLQGRALRDYSGFTYVFWLLCAAAVILKCVTACRNPGFCALVEPQPLINLQREPVAVPSPHLFISPSTSSNSPFESVLKADQSVLKVDQSLCNHKPELAQLPQKSADTPVPDEMEVTSHLDVSLEASSSCKESQFRDLPDDPGNEELVERNVGIAEPVVSMQPRRTDEVEVLLQDIREMQVPVAADPCEKPEMRTELRYCTLCNIDQPLRAKHCGVCKRCVARYDHHCPWLSVCIGQRNHSLFLCYLYLQWLETAVGIAAVTVELQGEEKDYIWYLRVVLVGVAGVILLALSSLTCYQTMLIVCNLTTWEYRSWEKVTYLQGAPRSLKSPFSQGCWSNWQLFLKGTCASVPLEWKVVNPSSKPVTS